MKSKPRLIDALAIDLISYFWSSLECADPVSALVFCDLSPPSAEITRIGQSSSAEDGGDRSPKTKAVTGYRTPKRDAHITEVIDTLEENLYTVPSV